MIFLTVHIEKYPSGRWLGYTEEFKGTVVSAGSEEEAKREILKSIRAKIAFDYKIPFDQVRPAPETPEELPEYFKQSKDNKYRVPLVP